jgi:hypothetical protein
MGWSSKTPDTYQEAKNVTELESVPRLLSQPISGVVNRDHFVMISTSIGMMRFRQTPNPSADNFVDHPQVNRSFVLLLIAKATVVLFPYFRAQRLQELNAR